MLSAEGISFSVDKAILLQPTTLHFTEGQFHVIMGANGAGKSTLLKLLAGDLRPATGRILLEGKELGHYSKKELATKRAVLSQHYHVTFPISVQDIVMMGRYPFFTTQPTSKDREVCRQVLQLMNVHLMADRDYNTLSGGEAQKVQMSRVLAQIWEAKEGDKKVLFLDEPVSHLDIKYQHQLLQAAKDLCAHGTTVVAILHDINQALSFADRLVFLKGGRVAHDLEQVGSLTTGIISDVFDVSASIISRPQHKPVVIFG